jgi:hypothetical protein
MADYVWQFTTGLIVSLLYHLQIQHVNGNKPNKTITNFSMIMDPLTINGTTFT